MRPNTNRSNARPANSQSDIASALSHRLVGQPAAIAAIVPYVEMHRAMLSPEGRPAGVFLLLGPTGTGKTKTVEALADVLHGNPKKLLKVDCGEYQMEHEVAKLLGAPPGYLGHRETQPLLTQQKVNAAASESCDLSVVLFDEIEKAAPTLVRLLLGVLDKATLRLGDNTVVNFEKSLIFLTSNLGAREMRNQLRPDFGFESVLPRGTARAAKLESIGIASVRRNFSPEFINRIDSVVTFQPLGPDALMEILDQQIWALEEQMNRRLGERAFHLEVPARTRKFLLERGSSSEYGARELKRTLQRLLIQPLAFLVSAGDIAPGSRIRAEFVPRRQGLVFRAVDLPCAEEDDDVLLPAC
ncbi:MAG TPA: AAA family ATPase [Bryobacteraceae bacterium]|nr:AAA family ATPase [Bryobacteraceae bacterium]